MKILFSIAVHESPDCVVDMCRNIKYFVPESIIVLHYQKGFFVSIPSDLEDYVYINNLQYATGFMDGSLTIVHLSNLYFVVDRQIDFNYFCPFGSNQLFVKHGYSKYIKNFDSSIANNVNVLDSQRAIFERDKGLKNFISNDNVLKSAPEGTFYKADIVKECIANQEFRQWFSINQVNYLSNESLMLRKLIRQVVRFIRIVGFTFLIPPSFAKFGYASEEIIFPSLFSGDCCGDKTCFIPWGRESLTVTENDVLSISESSSSYYSVKRVERSYTDKLRMFIKETIGNNYEL